MKLLQLVVLDIVAALNVVTAAQCTAPFKTLSSDCRDAKSDANTVCLVVDRSAGQSSPCGTTTSQRTCVHGATCDLLSYAINYIPSEARFHITFPGQTTSTRALRTAVEAVALPRVHVHVHVGKRSAKRTAGSGGSGDPPVGSPDTPMPTRPHLDPPKPTLVDFPPTTKPTTTQPPTAQPMTTPPPTAQPTTTPPPTAPPPTVKPTTTPPPTLQPTTGSGSGDEFPPPTTTTPTPSTFVPGPVDSNSDHNSNKIDPASESNAFIDSIGQLRLPQALTNVRIVGGASDDGARGQAANISMDPAMLAKSPQVTSVWIINCNIGNQLSTGNLLTGMPAGLTDLNLRNTLLRTEPSDLPALKNLVTLKLGQNYLTALSSAVSLPKLTTIELSENSLTSFAANLPMLESLDLSKNNFSAIPDVIYSMPKLRELYLTGNPIVAIVVSATQYDVLANLHLQIDKPPITPPQPVIYVAPDNKGVGLVLDSKDVDLNTAVTASVGTLMTLQGISMWKLPDDMYKVFQAQQDVITKSSPVIGGKKVLPYLANAAPSTASSKGTDGTQDAQPNGVPSPKKSHALTISLIVVAVVVILAGAFVFVRYRKQSGFKQSEGSVLTTASTRDGSTITEDGAESKAKETSRDSTESFGALATAMHDTEVRDLFASRRFRAADVEDVRMIGTSANGIVWLVKLRGSRLLASKRMTQSTSSSRLSQFVEEIVIAAGVEHPNIVSLVGVAWSNETDLQALYEYMPNGDLETHLKNTPPESLPWSPSKFRMAIEIVEALVYTHSFTPPLLHRDLRTKNVLLDGNMNPKLSNFGSARYAPEQNTTTTVGVGSSRFWLAPEILRGSTDYSDPSDMYAFGILLCELDTHKLPYEDVRDVEGNALTETVLMDLVARGRVHPTLMATCPPEIRDIVTRCLSQDPHDRPTAMQIAYELRVVVHDAV